MSNNSSILANNSNLRFGEIADEWFILKTYKNKKSTQLRYKYLLKNYIFPSFYYMKLSDINASNINEKLILLYESINDRLSDNTFRSILYIIKSIIKYAVNSGYILPVYINFEISENPFAKEVKILSAEQEKRLVGEIMQNKSSNSLGILLSLYTGIRLGEVCSLKVEDIDFNQKTLHITKTVQRLRLESENYTQLIITNPKSTYSIRTIPLPEFLIEILISYEINEYSKNNFVLNNKEIPYEPRTLQYAFTRIIEKCGYNDLHFHCLRHTFATKCIRFGFDLKTLSEILGHSNTSFTINKYVHSDLDIKRKQMDIINENWASVI